MNAATAKKKYSALNLKTIPFDLGKIHFIGIGGIGMSGIAEILHNLGYKISGSDLSDNYNVKRLKNLGIEVFIGHDAKNIEGASIIVKSTAVLNVNPEIIAAKEKKIPIVKRSEMLAELTKLKATVAISGSHGKTTTTSLIGHIFDVAELEPTIINGGVINNLGSNAKMGAGDWLVAEADESDGTFIKIPATIGVVTNIDPEHMDYWKDLSSLHDAFVKFITQLPFYGFGVMNIDHSVVREIVNRVEDRRIFTYSMSNPEAHIFCSEVVQENSKSKFKVIVKPELLDKKNAEAKEYSFELPAVGIHNVSNSLSAIGVALGIKIDIKTIQKALSTFGGVKRRFTIIGNAMGATIVDDYAHHPVEINATLNAAKQYIEGNGGRVIAVMQPHRFTRLENLFNEFSECFTNADEVIILPVYSAGETPIAGVDQFALQKAVVSKGKNAIALNRDEELPQELKQLLKPNDVVVCMGAGTITYLAAKLPSQL
jgi:UDP-N-acetylmuramate--alanine ligase